MAAGPVPPVDEQHLGVPVLGHQGVDERHARRAGAHDQVVDLDLCHAAPYLPLGTRVSACGRA